MAGSHLCYIISDIDKSVNFEATALALKAHGMTPVFILINCKNGALEHFLTEHQFELLSIEVPSIRQSFSGIRTCIRQLKKWDVQIVHCHLALANWIGLIAARYCRIPKRIFTRHSGEPLQLHWKEKWIDRLQNKWATHIVAISQTIDTLLQQQGVPDSKRVLIHHGFDIQRFQVPNGAEVERMRKAYNSGDNSPVIGVIARWMEWKGIQFTIQAFQQVIIQHPTAKLLLFGATENADFCKEITLLLQQLPPHSYQIVPFEQNVFDLYHLFDVYVHVPITKSCEAFGQTYVEALAAGTPSVFTLSGIASEFIHHEENALVVPFQDAAAIEQAINTLLAQPELRKKLADNGQQTVENAFSFQRFTNQLIQLYR
jgi:glycosyltransferase involved in cell wall biosynthesis